MTPGTRVRCTVLTAAAEHMIRPGEFGTVADCEAGAPFAAVVRWDRSGVEWAMRADEFVEVPDEFRPAGPASAAGPTPAEIVASRLIDDLLDDDQPSIGEGERWPGDCPADAYRDAHDTEASAT